MAQAPLQHGGEGPSAEGLWVQGVEQGGGVAGLRVRGPGPVQPVSALVRDDPLLVLVLQRHEGGAQGAAELVLAGQPEGHRGRDPVQGPLGGAVEHDQGWPILCGGL